MNATEKAEVCYCTQTPVQLNWRVQCIYGDWAHSSMFNQLFCQRINISITQAYCKKFSVTSNYLPIDIYSYSQHQVHHHKKCTMAWLYLWFIYIYLQKHGSVHKPMWNFPNLFSQFLGYKLSKCIWGHFPAYNLVISFFFRLCMSAGNYHQTSGTSLPLLVS
jgi:hypothetical protein